MNTYIVVLKLDEERDPRDIALCVELAGWTTKVEATVFELSEVLEDTVSTIVEEAQSN